MADVILTQERLKELLNYDPETGVFTRLIRSSNRGKVGDVAGSMNGNGYLAANIDRSSYKMHRVAFLYMTGAWPVKEVDHINGIRHDNKWNNLRQVTRAQNLQNQHGAKVCSSTGYLGVKPCPGRLGFFLAQINTNKKRTHLGTFPSPELAHEAYLIAKRKMHSTCTI